MKSSARCRRVAQPLEQLHQVPLRDRVESRGRLVGDQQLRVGRERARQQHPLALPARELVRVGPRQTLRTPRARPRRADRRPGPPHARRGNPRWSLAASLTWKPTERTGLSARAGSWNTRPARPPRSEAQASLVRGEHVLAADSTRVPAAIVPGSGISRRSASAVSVLPHPDSPTSPTTSPSSTVRTDPVDHSAPAVPVARERRPRRSQTSRSGHGSDSTRSSARSGGQPTWRRGGAAGKSPSSRSLLAIGLPCRPAAGPATHSGRRWVVSSTQGRTPGTRARGAGDRAGRGRRAHRREPLLRPARRVPQARSRRATASRSSWRRARVIQVAILSGRLAAAVKARLADLGIAARPRRPGEPGQEGGTSRPSPRGWGSACDEVAFMGDDLPDLPALASAGLAACPADAVRGGPGAVAPRVPASRRRTARCASSSKLVLEARGRWVERDGRVDGRRPPRGNSSGRSDGK